MCYTSAINDIYKMSNSGNDMIVYEQALLRFLASCDEYGASDRATRDLIEQAFCSGWKAAGGDWLLIDRIPMEDENSP